MCTSLWEDLRLDGDLVVVVLIAISGSELLCSITCSASRIPLARSVADGNLLNLPLPLPLPLALPLPLPLPVPLSGLPSATGLASTPCCVAFGGL